MPPLASAGFSNGATESRPSGAAITVLAPFSTTTWFHGRRRVAGAPRAGRVVGREVAVRLGLEAAARPQPGELAGVRGEDGRPAIALPPVLVGRERAERLGVEDDAGALPSSPAARSSRTSSAVARPGRRPGPMTIASWSWSRIAGEGRLRVDLLDVVLRQGHRRRLDDLRREQRLERLGHRERHEPGARPARGPADEQRGAGVVERAGDDEELAERALVAALVADRAGALTRSGRRGARRPRRAASGRRLPARRRRPSAGRTPSRHAGPRLQLGRSASSGLGAPAFSSCSSRSRSIRASSRRSRSSSRSSMSSGKTYLPAARPDPERDRDRVIRFVADRERDPVHPELVGAGGGPAVQADGRLAGRQPLDLDVAPADPPDAEPEDLADGLLGRPAAGERLGPHPDVALLGGGQDALRESLAEPLDRAADPVDLDDVDPELRDARLGAGQRRDRGSNTQTDQ